MADTARPSDILTAVTTAPTDAKVLCAADDPSKSDVLITPADLVKTAAFLTNLRTAATTAAHLDALTAALTALKVQVPDFSTGAIGKILSVLSATTGQLIWNTGHSFPEETEIGDADGAFAFGTTGALVRTGANLTANRVFPLNNTNVPQNHQIEILRDDDGPYTLTVQNYGPSDALNWAMGPRESARFRFSDSYWRFMGWASTTRDIDMRGGVLKAPKLTGYTEDATGITSASGVLTIDMSKPVQRFTMTENVTQVLFTNKSTAGAQGPVIDIIQGVAPYTIDPAAWPDETVFLTETAPDTSVLGEGAVMRLVLEFNPLDSTTVRGSYAQSWSA